VIGRSLDELELPDATTIGGIVRGDKLMIAHHDVVIEAGDHVNLFVMDKRQMPRVNALFQASSTIG
jgi:trk system potassium uptake protein TrkA